MDITTDSLSELITNLGHKIKSKTSSSLVVLVKGDRVKQLKELTLQLSNLGAKHDPSAKGSSIGAIVVGKIKITIKADGKTGGLDVEAAAIDSLQSAIMGAMATFGGPLTIRLPKKTVKGIVGVEKTAGTPKSDFHLIDENGRPKVFISHKKGSTPKDFQQWGGMTEKEILNHKEVQAFAMKCKAKFGEKLPPGTSVFSRIKDPRLSAYSVYGVDFGKVTGINNVDVLLQGDPYLIPQDSTFKLMANNVHYNGETLHGGFAPVLALIYKGDRDNLGIKGARASIYPAGGRRMEEIK